jgi:hypothetical protein
MGIDMLARQFVLLISLRFPNHDVPPSNSDFGASVGQQNAGSDASKVREHQVDENHS